MNNNINCKVLEYGICGIREIQLVKDEHIIEHQQDDKYMTDCDFVTTYEIQIRIPYFLFWHKWITLAIWGVLNTLTSDKDDVNRDLILAKMGAYTLYNKMIKYGGFQNSSK